MRTILLLATLLLAGCMAPVEPADIAVASYPAAFVAENLAGDDLRVVDLSASGGLHDFEPSARDIQQLRKSTHLVLWDESLESWAHRAEESLGRNAPNVIEISTLPDGDEYIEADDHGDDHGHDHGAHDPHTWNDPLAMIASVDTLADELMEAYPDIQAGIDRRANDLKQRLHELDDDMVAGLADCQRDTIVTNHEAYNYLARRYNFNIFALHGLEPGSQPSPQTINEAIRIIRETGTPSLFIEEGTDPDAVRAIRSETGVEIRVLITNESRPAAGDYVDSQRINLFELQVALGCS